MPELLTQAAGTVVALAATATALGALSRLRPVRWLWHQLVACPLSRWFRGEVNEVIDLRLRPVNERLDRIDEQLHPNQGSSLRDVADRIEASVTDQGGPS